MHAHFAVVYLQVPLRICLSERVQPRQLEQIAQNITYALQPEIRAVAAGKGSSNHKKTAPLLNGNSFFLSRHFSWGLFCRLTWEWEKGKIWWSCDVADRQPMHFRPAPQSQEQFKHFPFKKDVFKYRTALSPVSADISLLFNFCAGSHQLRIWFSISL